MSHKEQIQIKAQILAKVLEKHNPTQLKDLSFKLMQKTKPGSDEFKCLAALHEIMDVLK